MSLEPIIRTHRQALLFSLAALAVYVWLTPSHVVHGDNAEFASLAALGGTAHPSGYPLYVLWLRLWAWLPLEAAHAASVATAVLAAAQLFILHAACRAWGAGAWAATLATGLYAAAPVALRLNTEAEVFALNGLVAATVLWLVPRGGPLHGSARVAALAVVAGLGLSNHLTCSLMAPIGVLGVVRGVHESKQRMSTVAIGIASFGAGLLPYAYLFVAPDSAPSWTTINTVSEFWHHVMRGDYGGPAAFSPRNGQTATWSNLVALGATLARSYLWVLAIAGGIVLGHASVRRAVAAETRVAWMLLAVSWCLAGPLLVAQFNIEPTHVGRYVVERFHLLCLLLLAPAVALACDRLSERLPARAKQLGALARTALVSAALIVATAVSLDEIARAHSPAVERGLSNMLRTLPANAILIGSTDEFHFGMIYLQAVRGERNDVAVITTPQLGLAHYRERVRRSTGIVVQKPREAEKLSITLVEQAFATGRPVFIDPYQATIAGAFPSYPYGILFRILPRGSKLPAIVEVFALNKELFGRYSLDYAFPSTQDQLATQFHFHYARVWKILAEALAREGRIEEHAFAVEMARALAPREP